LTLVPPISSSIIAGMTRLKISTRLLRKTRRTSVRR